MEDKKKAIIWPLSLFIVTILTRIPFTSKYLYNWDSVQFALALEKYDITVHQPHPPGYFLYVMLGRLVNLFIKDANNTFIFISILFSGLAIVAIYFLGKEIFDKKTGVLAALIALTSPNLWFHGEVALTYAVEAFFSSFVALLCWRIFKGDHKYIWLSVIALGIAGGIRQNTIVFLFPLWLFSVKGVPIRKIIVSLGLLGVVCLLWFVPMVWMTGGWNAYNEAFREYWMFVIGYLPVFYWGWASFKIFSLSLFHHIILALGVGFILLCFTVYSIIRRRQLKYLERSKVLFFGFWIATPVLFYLTILYHPACFGYVLILLPALCIITTAAIRYISAELITIIKKDIYSAISSFIIILNTACFFFLTLPVSFQDIRNHERRLTIILNEIQKTDSKRTAVFIEPYINNYAYRHIMYYLPAYYVCDMSFSMSRSGERRKTFCGINKITYLTNGIIIPEHISNFVMLKTTHDIKKLKANEKINIYNIVDLDVYLITGDIRHINELFPISGHIKLMQFIYPELSVPHGSAQ